MPPLVVDAGVVAKWYFDEPGSREARAVLARALEEGQPVIAPDLLAIEMANLAWKKARRGEVTVEQAAAICRSVPESVGGLVASGPLLVAALEIANTLLHPVYDCVYVALAEAEDGVLVTADRRLLAATVGTRWAARVRCIGGE